MTLYKRTVLILISTLLGLVLILFAASRLILLGSFVDLERDAVMQEVERAVWDLRQESKRVSQVAADWAAADEMYAYVEKRDASILETRFNRTALSNLEVDFMVVADVDGQVTLAQGVDQEELNMAWIEDHVIQELIPAEQAVKPMVHGLTTIAGQAVVLGASPIRSGKWSGPVVGILIVGSSLEEALPRDVIYSGASTLTLHSLNSERRLPGFERILQELTEGSRLKVEPVNEELVAGYALMHDLAGEQALLLEIRSPRTIYDSGRDGLSYYVLSLMLAGLVFGLVFLLLMDRSVLSRLERVSNRVQAIGKSSDFAARVELQGHDELAELGQGINSMLDELEKAQKALRTAHDELERRVEERTEELRQAQQQVIEQERMRALGQMASGIAHDFNNALATILGSCELLMMEQAEQGIESDSSGEDDSLLESIHTAARDAANAVSRLREFYRYRDEKEALQNVDLSRVAKQVISMTEPMWKDQAQARGVTLRIDTKFRHLPLVPANEAELREMLTNLIFNAIDAMPEGGTITLGTDYTDTHVSVSVSDTGVGMSDETRRRCLEPFFTTKGKKGTGLGLAMVHGTVRRHEGQLEIHSKPGEGTTIEVLIPLETTRGKADIEEVSIDPLPSMKVLLVDDVPSVRRIVRAYLTADGHTVDEAVNGREGLERFYADTYDMVITDRGMPEMGGDQLAVEVAQADPTIPVLMLTGFGEMMKSAGERPDGVHLVLSKPVTVNKLRRAMRQTIELCQRTLDEPPSTS